MTTDQTSHRNQTPKPETASPVPEPATPGHEGAALEAMASANADLGTAEPADRADHRAFVLVRSAANSGLRVLRRGAFAIAHGVPPTMRASRDGMTWTVETLQTLPDATLRSIAATSIGIGAGLSFTRAGRLAALVGVVPAALVEAAIAFRPSTPSSARAVAE